MQCHTISKIRAVTYYPGELQFHKVPFGISLFQDLFVGKFVGRSGVPRGLRTPKHLGNRGVEVASPKDFEPPFPAFRQIRNGWE